MSCFGGGKVLTLSSSWAAYCVKKIEKIIADVTIMDITDDGLWYTLRVMGGSHEEDFENLRTSTQLCDTTMRIGVFVE